MDWHITIVNNSRNGLCEASQYPIKFALMTIRISPKTKIMRFIILSALLFFFTAAKAQDTADDNTLQKQFDDMKTRSNNYQIYKVVKVTDLDSFWSSAKDTLKSERKEIIQMRSEINALKAEVNSLQAQVNERDNTLEEQEYQIEHMSFLGIPLTKSAYITFTWVLIFGLLIAAIVFYARFHGAHKVTSQTQSEMKKVQEEFDLHRQRTRDNETKLKRDLQTEINRVEELKAQLEGNA